MPTFRHSGAIGDLLYCLPVVRAMGGGELLLDVGPRTNFWTHLYGNPTASLRPLLLRQPYVTGVRELTPSDRVDHDLDMWRSAFNGLRHPRTLTIPAMALMAFGLPASELDRPWLAADPVRVPGRPILFGRTARYHSRFFRWGRVVARYGDAAAFVGSADEHAAFCREYGDLPHAATADFLELAGLIAGCARFFCNQSSPYVVAEAMHKDLVLEVCPTAPNGLTFRPGASYHMFY